MATATRDPILQYAPDAQASGKRWGVTPSVLLGLVDVESGGRMNSAGGGLLTSSAGAKGLTQFEPGTRDDIQRRYGVDAYANPASAIEAAAIYLHELGFSKDARSALAKYNAGGAPGFLQRAGGYPGNVLAAAKRYGGLSTNTKAPTVADTLPAENIPANNSSGDLSGFGGDALKALVWIVLVAGGTMLAGLGVRQLAGART